MVDYIKYQLNEEKVGQLLWLRFAITVTCPYRKKNIFIKHIKF